MYAAVYSNIELVKKCAPEDALEMVKMDCSIREDGYHI